jgi:ankyrin repeat protein
LARLVLGTSSTGKIHTCGVSTFANAGSASSPLPFTPSNDYDNDAIPQLAREGIIHLLDAGADPLLEVDGYASLIIYALNISNLVFYTPLWLWSMLTIAKELLRLILDHALIDLDSPIARSGASALLYTATLLHWPIALESGLTEQIHLLLERGANPNARNSSRQTWMHIAFENASDWTSLSRQFLLTILSLLVKFGLDVHAVDCHGTTIAQCAYLNHCGMLWKGCLTALGLNDAEICGQHSTGSIAY